MSQTDGAMVLNQGGEVLMLRGWLQPDTDVFTDTRSDGGTRHRTAKAFSHSLDGFVVVTSADGPVTVYAKGKSLVSTKQLLGATHSGRRAGARPGA